jgi:hypothetical protein
LLGTTVFWVGSKCGTLGVAVGVVRVATVSFLIVDGRRAIVDGWPGVDSSYGRLRLEEGEGKITAASLS